MIQKNRSYPLQFNTSHFIIFFFMGVLQHHQIKVGHPFIAFTVSKATRDRRDFTNASLDARQFNKGRSKYMMASCIFGEAFGERGTVYLWKEWISHLWCRTFLLVLYCVRYAGLYNLDHWFMWRISRWSKDIDSLKKSRQLTCAINPKKYCTAKTLPTTLLSRLRREALSSDFNQNSTGWS